MLFDNLADKFVFAMLLLDIGRNSLSPSKVAVFFSTDLTPFFISAMGKPVVSSGKRLCLPSGVTTEP